MKSTIRHDSTVSFHWFLDSCWMWTIYSSTRVALEWKKSGIWPLTCVTERLSPLLVGLFTSHPQLFDVFQFSDTLTRWRCGFKYLSDQSWFYQVLLTVKTPTHSKVLITLWPFDAQQWLHPANRYKFIFLIIVVYTKWFLQVPI